MARKGAEGNKKVRKFVKILRDAGYDPRMSGSGHCRVLDRDGSGQRVAQFSLTPSPLAVKRIRNDLNKLPGVEIP